MDVPPAAWTAVAGVVGSAFAAVVGWLANHGKSEADIAAVWSESWTHLVTNLREEVKRANEKAGRAEQAEQHCEERFERLGAEHYRLVSWLRDQGLNYPGEHEQEG